MVDVQFNYREFVKSISITDGELKILARSALAAALTPNHKRAQQAFKAVTNGHTGKGKDPLKGVRKWVSNTSSVGQINITGDYRLKWFEAGTKKRVTKKRGYFKTLGGINRGQMQPTYFFSNVINSGTTQAEVWRQFDEKMLKKIERKWGVQ